MDNSNEVKVDEVNEAGQPPVKKKRGRPAKPKGENLEAGAVKSPSVGSSVKVKSGRSGANPGNATSRIRERIPVGGRDILKLPSRYERDKTHYYRWILEKEVDTHIDAGYTICRDRDKEATGEDSRVGLGSSMESAYTRVSGDTRLVLVRLPMEYREEDIRAKEAKIIRFDDPKNKGKLKPMLVPSTGRYDSDERLNEFKVSHDTETEI